MQGIFIDNRRPKSKKEIREAVRDNPGRVRVEATSLFPGTEYEGPVSEIPLGKVITFVGPDPFIKRNFYGSIRKTSKGIEVK